MYWKMTRNLWQAKIYFHYGNKYLEANSANSGTYGLLLCTFELLCSETITWW